MLKANKENKIGIILVSEAKPDYSFAAHRSYINGFTTPSRLDGKQRKKCCPQYNTGHTFQDFNTYYYREQKAAFLALCKGKKGAH